jgi:Sulfotransferase family
MHALSVDELLRTAQERTGLSDFGPADFREGLAVIVDGINGEAQIRESAWPNLRERFLRLLMNRLWFAKDVSEYPEILNEDLGAPVVIAALPRTGSTKLHRMLGAAGGFKTTPFWMVNMFARIPGLPDGGRERRIAETRAYEKWMYQVSPDNLTGHPMFTEEPEEDQWTMEYSFRHSLLFGMFHSLKYAGWISQADLRPTFDYFRMQLKYLQWQMPPAPDKPWLLKTPNHLGDEPALTRILGKPRWIVTHRDPMLCVPSVIHTAMASRRIHSDYDSSATLRAGILDVFSGCARRHLAWRDSHPEVEILDLAFRDITLDGIGTARRVYAFLGLPFTPEAERGVREWERNNPKDKHGKANYSAASLGTTEAAIRQAFAAYRERFAAYF